MIIVGKWMSTYTQSSKVVKGEEGIRREGSRETGEAGIYIFGIVAAGTEPTNGRCVYSFAGNATVLEYTRGHAPARHIMNGSSTGNKQPASDIYHLTTVIGRWFLKGISQEGNGLSSEAC